MLRLPEKEAKSVSFLSYSIIGLAFFNYSDDDFVKIVDLVFSVVSFFLATLLYIKNNLTFPLFPCKNRCITDSKLFCNRDAGFILGVLFSIIVIYVIKQYDLLKFINISQYYFLTIGVFLVMLTIIHGTLRIVYGIAKNHEFVTFVIGILTGIGTLFIALFFIMSDS